MRIALVFKDTKITKFVQDADMFEPFKVLVQNTHAILTVNSWSEEQTHAIRKASEGSEYTLVACFGIDVVYWIDPEVKVVSTGTHWGLIEDYVNFYQRDLALENDKNSAWHVGIPNE